ncbi:MAG: hypothetical protein ABIO36_09735, partial [Pyrinomonadaceae bacterium]
ESLTLEQLTDLDDPYSALIRMEEAVAHLPKLELTDDRIDKTRNGLPTRITDQTFNNGEAVRMQDAAGNLVAIGFYDLEENIVRPKVVLI